MKRRWVKLDEIDAYDKWHQPDGELGFKIVEPDPQNYEQHRAGVDFIKKKLLDGVKIRPILIIKKKDGGYERLDGFKRWQAHRELGWPVIECFVASNWERGSSVVYQGQKMLIQKGGQCYTRFKKLTEYDEDPNQENGSCGKIRFLYNHPSLRVELREAIHIHWGMNGTNRLLLGLKDFEALVEAFNGKIS